MAISGHRSEASLRSYHQQPSVNQLRKCSDVLTVALSEDERIDALTGLQYTAARYPLQHLPCESSTVNSISANIYVFSDHSDDVDIQRYVQLMHNRQCKHHFQSVTSLLLFKSRVKSILFARYLSFPAALFDIRASNSNFKIFSFIAHCHLHCHFFGDAQNRSQFMIGSPMILKRIKNLIRL